MRARTSTRSPQGAAANSRLQKSSTSRIATIPIDAFDFIIADECRRPIYNLWRQVLEYFDAFPIGVTATPGKQAIDFFNQNLVSEYPHERALADGVNVGYDVYRIKKQVTAKGLFVDRRDKNTRETRPLHLLGFDIIFNGFHSQLDRIAA